MKSSTNKINKARLLYLLIILLLLFYNKSTAQSLDSIISTLKLPKDWSVSIDKRDTNYLDDFHKKKVAMIVFLSAENSVKYDVFEYKNADSLQFANGLMQHYMKSNCNTDINDDWNKNLSSFVKGGYYFLLEYCPCRSTKYPECGTLAMTLNKWRKNK